MKYRDMIAFFDAQIKEVGSRKFTAEMFLDVLAKPDGCGKKADMVCTHFACNLKWIEMDDETACEVCLRLACARWYCDLPQLANVSEDDFDYPEQMREWLVEYWNDTGKEDWICEGILGLTIHDK